MIRRFRLSLLSVLTAAAVAALPLDSNAQQPSAADPEPNVIEITAVDYAIRAPERVAPGWTRIRFTNDGEEPHFVFMSRLPENRTLEDYETDLSGVYARAWYALRDGRANADEALHMVVGGMPAWFPELHLVGGPGLLAAGRTAEVLLNLEPGTYVLECYIKNAEGEIHYMDGMIREMEVAGAPRPTMPPEPDVRVTLANDGMTVEGDLTPGRRVFLVHARENPEAGFGHSAHLARLDENADVEEIVRWMNWFELQGLRTPAPAEFLGGLHPMPAGSTGYFVVNLEPGRYLLLSEGTGHTGVLHEFRVR